MPKPSGSIPVSGYEAEARLASASYKRLFRFKKCCEAALWAGIAVFSVLILAAPRFMTLLLHVFNDPFVRSRAYCAVAPVFFMIGCLLLVRVLVELLLVVRRLPSKVVSLESATGLDRGAGALLALAVLEIIRVCFYPMLVAAICAVCAVLVAIAGFTLAAWIRWQAQAQTAAAISNLPPRSHLRSSGTRS